MTRIALMFDLLIVILLSFQLAVAHMIEVGASKKECFFEDLHKNDQVGVHNTSFTLF